ncbi:protein transport protein Sec16B-like isoform X2 [Alosa sapidissima]|uniref:protein transport protein Sec16B-like isoform X2 n=1 Tax=Alosa sapidissima TaxID=34773 RepID=UPI001C0A1C2D|nr:protein transport protein Sec16B-like isoform X2 [Alosa sapidissima]
MTSETESLALEMSVKMSDEGTIREPKAVCGALLSPELPLHVKELGDVPSEARIHGQHQVEALGETEAKKPICQARLERANARSHAWWDFYFGRYEAFFAQVAAVSPKLDYLDCNSDSQSDEEDVIQRDLLALKMDALNGKVIFPGPLVRGVTDHRAVYHYILTEWQRCINDESIEDKAGVDMVWRMLAMMWRKNGMVSGKDLAIQLLQQLHGTRAPDSRGQDLVELLILNRKEEALNLAIKNEYWEHALILDSFFRKASCVPSITRFISSLYDSDPMKTYYHVFLGQIPGVVSKCGDMSWREWCPHLAILLANSICPQLQNVMVNMLADTLARNGHTWSAHFCYMAMRIEPSYYHRDSKLTLIGQDFSMPLKEFACDAAIQRTEAYEYLLSFNTGNQCLRFQTMKILYSCRLLGAGHFAEALKYTEAVATVFLAHSVRPCPALTRLLKLCDALCVALPIQFPCWIEPPWMATLRRQGNDSTHEDLNEPDHGSEQPHQVVPLDNETQVSAQDGEMEMSRPESSAHLQDVSEAQCVALTSAQETMPLHVENERSGRHSPVDMGEGDEHCLSEDSGPASRSRMKRFWIRCFGWCGKAQD